MNTMLVSAIWGTPFTVDTVPSVLAAAPLRMR